MDFSSFTQIALSLLTLTVLEVVLGIDNLVFIAILSGRLPPSQQRFARRLGLTLAWVMRLILLATAVWLVGLTRPLIQVGEWAFSGRDLFFLLGGLFLILKGTQEIHNELEPEEPKGKRVYSRVAMIVAQIAVMDIVFSLDTVITAVGLTTEYWIMATAITIAIIGMLFLSEPLAHFVNRHPTVKMLALSFLLLIGTVLLADAFHVDIPRGYIYMAVCFSLLVEGLNIVKRNRKRG